MSDESQLISLDEPYPGTDPEPEPKATEDDAEPEGAVEVQPGRRMVDVSVVAAERKRAREAAEKRVRETELEPLRQRASQVDQLQAALEAAKPWVELAQQNQHRWQQQEVQLAPEDQISDAEAEQEARELQLYNAESKLDLRAAKRVIARRRSEAQQVAQQAAQEAIAPLTAITAEQGQKQQFLQMVNELGADDILSPQDLARQFAELGPQLTQHPEIAKVALERAVGRAYLQRRQRTGPRPTREPVMSESPGGRSLGSIGTSETSRKLGLSDADLKASGKHFVPGGVSEIGSF